MAQKKKRRKRRTDVKSTLVNEIFGILIIALSILIFFGVFFEKSTGVFGSFISSLMSGLLGWTYRLLPFLVFFFGLSLLFSKVDHVFKKRFLNGILLIIFISCFFQIAYYDKNPAIYSGLNILEKFKKYYTDGTLLMGGGVFGAMVSMPVISVFATVGAYIIFITLTVVNLIIITNRSFKNFLLNIKKMFVALFRWMYESFKPMEETGYEYDYEEKKIYEQQKISVPRQKKPIDFKIEEKIQEAEPEEIEIMEQPQPVVKKQPIKTIKADETEDAQKVITEVKSQQLPSGQVYRFPPVTLLDMAIDTGKGRENLNQTAKKLEETLSSFGVEAKVVNYSKGPTVTRYELQPQTGVKVSRITSLADDIALNLASRDVRIEAPVPGKSVVGIEVPNREKSMVTLREIIESEEFMSMSSPVTISVGKDIGGKIIVADIKKMPHLLIAGATGSGKSVCINCLITSILYKASPDDVKLLLIDPKKVELGNYNGIPHLLIPVVTNVKKASGALTWAVVEMTQRYDKFSAVGAKDLQAYNEKAQKDPSLEKLPHIVIIIDELADLMAAAPGEVEDSIIRLAQLARAAGMHLVIATQRPSVNVITGLIKANIPSRIAFSVVSQVDSRTILDMGGAEKLLGSGDLLYHPIGMTKPIRLQGAFVSDNEILKVVEFIKGSHEPSYDDDVIEKINNGKETAGERDDEIDELLAKAIDIVIEAGQASVSYIQRKFKVGYARAARIVDQMEERGIVGPFEGSKPRSVLITKDEWEELKLNDPESYDYRDKQED